MSGIERADRARRSGSPLRFDQKKEQHRRQRDNECGANHRRGSRLDGMRKGIGQDVETPAKKCNNDESSKAAESAHQPGSRLAAIFKLPWAGWKPALRNVPSLRRWRFIPHIARRAGVSHFSVPLCGSVSTFSVLHALSPCLFFLGWLSALSSQCLGLCVLCVKSSPFSFAVDCQLFFGS